jgi:thiol:disulfide interchange protein
MKRSRLLSAALVSALLFGSPRSSAADGAPAPGGPPAAPAPTATAVYEEARAEAGKRGVFLAFHASWCVWCKALEKLTVLPGARAVFDRHYAVAWITVDERASRKALENPGAAELRSRLGCDGVALPFYVVVNPEGKVVASSVRTGPDGAKTNVGFPGSRKEVESFLAIFRAGAPDLTEDEERALVKGIAGAARR